MSIKQKPTISQLRLKSVMWNGPRMRGVEWIVKTIWLKGAAVGIC